MLRTSLALLIGFTFSLLLGAPAHADPKCEKYDNRGGTCDTDAHDGQSRTTHPGGRGKSTPRRCVDSTFIEPSRVLPCVGPLGQWSNDRQCYLKLYAGEPSDPNLVRRFHCRSPQYSGAVDLGVCLLYTSPSPRDS